MNQINVKNTSGYLDFVYEFHEMMTDQKILLAYEGKISHDVTLAFTELAETKLNISETDEMVTQRVYHVMVECLQNICKHADDEKTGEFIEPGSGIFLVGMNEEGYRVTTGNAIANSKIEYLSSTIDEINSLNKDELKAVYKKKLVENRLSDKGGAGLGLLDIARKTGQKIEYNIKPINDKTSFFLLNIIILKINT